LHLCSSVFFPIIPLIWLWYVSEQCWLSNKSGSIWSSLTFWKSLRRIGFSSLSVCYISAVKSLGLGFFNGRLHYWLNLLTHYWSVQFSYFYISNDLSEKEIKKIIPLTIASRDFFKLRNKFNEEYVKTMKNWLKKLKMTQTKDIPSSWAGKIKIVKISILPKAT
jgi:hypothetical protein